MRQTKQTTESEHVTGLLWIVFALITLWRVWAAWVLPITRDEAYYLDWARNLAWGFFDHPPGVALLGAGTLLSPASALAGRLGTVLAATLTLLVLLRLYRSCGLRGSELVVAAVVASATLPGLASGVLATPDTALGLCWALAMHECLAALRGERRRWLGAGVATGLGLLSKYTMALVGPVFLWVILWADPKALRTPWPYLGGLLALLVFAPNLAWNAANDWLTIRFQFGHGFSTETGSFVANSLPVPAGELPATPVETLEQRSAGESAGEVLAFLGTQVALWGFVLLPVAVALIRGRGTPPRGRPALDRAAKALLVAGSLFPLAFFTLLASFSEVEPNWPGMYLLTAAPIVAIAVIGLRTWVLAAGAGNLLFATLYVVHGATGVLPLADSQQRVLRETHGYRELAQRVEPLPGALFGDRYQIVAMMRFHAPSLEAGQWPGITRPSEYLRDTISAHATIEQLRRDGGFWLVSRRWVPPEIPGFRARSHSVLFDCFEDRLIEVPAGAAVPCRKPLHRWSLIYYAAESAQ
jgi:4-amino-4-deoxy-L-arabinose transferase-like glycosyltransferase